MEFANTTYLWGFLGILLPIAIHLWSRKKVITIKVGSVKLLQASEPKQTSSLKLNEWWLLFLRVLTIALLALIFSKPSITKTVKNQSINYLLEPSLLKDDRLSSFLDTVSEASVRLLTEDFPYWKDLQDAQYVETPEYWQLAQQMKTITADSLVVFSKGYFNGIKGKRPTIQANAKWIVLEPENKWETPVSARQKQDHIEILSANSATNVLTFIKDTISLEDDRLEFNAQKDSVRWTSSKTAWLKLKKDDVFKVGVLQSDTLPEQTYYITAAYRAISKFIDRPIEIITDAEVLESSNINTIIVLGDLLPKNFEGNLLIYKPDSLANGLIEKGSEKNLFYLTQLLDSENIVNDRFTEKLLTLLNRHESLDEVIWGNDQRVVAENELQPVLMAEHAFKNRAQLLEMTPWLWLFLMLVVVVERILSRVRKQ